MTKRLKFLLYFFILLTALTFGQTVEKVVVSKEDPNNLYNFEPTDTESLFYLKLVPEAKPIGCLVILPSSGELVESVMKQTRLHELAVQQNLLVVFPSINWGSSKFISAHEFLDTIFKQVVEEYEIPKNKLSLEDFQVAEWFHLPTLKKQTEIRTALLLYQVQYLHLTHRLILPICTFKPNEMLNEIFPKPLLTKGIG